MDLLSAKTIKELLAKYDAKPSKLMGQNFLIDANTLNKIITASELSPKDTVVEVGPGMGILTQALSKDAKRVVAIEKDRVMVKILKETIQNQGNVEVIEDNALKFNPLEHNLKQGEYKVVANIPYYLTSPLIRKFLEEKTPPNTIVLMIQKEVAQRICAKPPNMSLLAVSVQFYATAKIISHVSKQCFWPVPKVDSAIIKIIPFETLPTQAGKKEVDATAFFNIVKAGFSQPRKQLANNLSKALKMEREKVNIWLLANSIKPEQRAETLAIQDWINLINGL